MKEIKRGQIWYADLSPVIGSEQGGYRPVLIIQNDIGNKYSPTTIIAIITSRYTKAKLPTHYWLDKGEGGLACDSMIELEQVRTIDKKRLKDVMGEINPKHWANIDKCLKISLGMWENAVFQNLPKEEKIGKPHLTNETKCAIIIIVKER